MANENELEIVLTLIDNASKELKKITGEVKKDTESIAKESEKASKTVKDGFKDAGKELKSFRQATFAVTAEIAFIATAVKAWGDHNLETRNALNQLGTDAKSIFAMFGSIFAPAVRALSDAIKDSMGVLKSFFKTIQEGYTKMFEKISFGIQYIISFGAALKEGIGIAEAHRIAMTDAGRAAEEMANKFKAAFTENITQIDEAKKRLQDHNQLFSDLNLKFLDGKISAQEYYDTLTLNEVAHFYNMQTRMTLMQQMTMQENLMRDQSLMNYRTDVEARMGLLKTLQSYHHTIYSTMMDFGNMVIQKISTGMTTALTSIIMGTKKATEAFKEFGIAMVTAIVEFVIQYGIQMLIAAALSKIIMASTIAQATAISAAWLPAAIFASIATMGGASAAGMAGFTSATAGGMAIGQAAINLGRITVSKPAEKAEGGWVGLNGPQMALVGERGPEYIVPNNRIGNMSGQTYINIEINNPQVRSDEDIDRLTEEISQRLANEAERL